MPHDFDLAAGVANASYDIGSFIRTQREAAHVSMRQLAEKAGVSNPYRRQIERGLRKPSADVLSQIAKALRVSAEILDVQAGILEPRAVRDAIITDAAITRCYATHGRRWCYKEDPRGTVLSQFSCCTRAPSTCDATDRLSDPRRFQPVFLSQNA